MDVRPQGPEIIRTWLFSTVLRSHYEHGALPWSHASVNGWILDPDRKKMSKSRGNVITPLPLIEEYGAEAVRYWACNGRPGADTAVDYGVMKIGRRLALKILNAAVFVLGFSDYVGPGAIVAPIDRSMIAALDRVVSEATVAFDRFDYARALETTESSFWDWTDDYLELVKGRAYDGGSAGASAHAALQVSLSVYLRCRAFSPSSPRKFGRGGVRDPCIASHGLTHRSSGLTLANQRCSRWRSRRWRSCAGPSPRPRSRWRLRSSPSWSGEAGRLWPWCARRSLICCSGDPLQPDRIPGG